MFPITWPRWHAGAFCRPHPQPPTATRRPREAQRLRGSWPFGHAQASSLSRDPPAVPCGTGTRFGRCRSLGGSARPTSVKRRNTLLAARWRHDPTGLPGPCGPCQCAVVRHQRIVRCEERRQPDAPLRKRSGKFHGVRSAIELAVLNPFSWPRPTLSVMRIMSSGPATLHARSPRAH